MTDSMTWRIGIDFDNTIVTYEQVLRQYISDHALPVTASTCCKRQVRDYLRSLTDGERQWQALQAYMYGPGMRDAVLIEGVHAFLTWCRQLEIPVYVVSHKTDYATTAPSGMNLRTTALSWMEQWLFDKETGLTADRVFFESSRVEKAERIYALGCTHFIDDLEETFLEPAFPSDVAKIWYVPETETAQGIHAGCLPMNSWSMITRYFQGLRHGV